MDKIYATLKYGRYMGSKRINVLKSCFYIILSSFILLLLLFLICINDFISQKSWDIIISYGLILLFTLISIIILFISQKTGERQKSEIKNWYENSIEFKAFAYRIDVVNKKNKPYQIAVKFKWDGKELIRESSPGSIVKGWHKEFAKYDNKQIKILYSPNYDEVMILKD